jgi:hypothetical protein
MANQDKPFGLRPHSSLNNSPYCGNVRMFYVPSTTGTAIFIGDPVKLGGTEGKLNPDDAPMPTVVIGTINDVMVGVVVGIIPVRTDLEILYRKASTSMYVLVDVDPNTIFELQGDLDTWDAGDVGYNMSLTFTTGSTVTGVSAMVADQSTAANTATLDLQVLGSKPSVDNDLTGAFPLILVRLNNHQYVDGTTGL